ncbi:MAG: hypothetical protein IJ448_01020 [Oscillospiraceae bacterium]|nr:hypothetical protein [Oscillospiraceae bacterium]
MKKACALLLAIAFILSASGCTPSSRGGVGYMITSIEEFNQALYPDDAAVNGSENANSANRQDVYVTPLLRIGYPAAKEGVAFENFCYTYGYSYPCGIAFTIDGIRYQFQYQNDEGKVIRFGMPVVATYQIGSHTVKLYQGIKCLVGEIYENGYEVVVTVRNYASVEDIDFDAIDWIIVDNSDHQPS